MKDKIVSADEAVAIIRDRDTLCTSGFVGVGTPDELLVALEKRYRETRLPRISRSCLPLRPEIRRIAD